MPLPIGAPPPNSPNAKPPAAKDAAGEAIRRSAEKLEAGFLAEMLGRIQVEESAKAFGGGMGGQMFQSFLSKAYAEAVVARGGIGLASVVSDALNKGTKA